MDDNSLLPRSYQFEHPDNDNVFLVAILSDFHEDGDDGSYPDMEGKDMHRVSMCMSIYYTEKDGSNTTKHSECWVADIPEHYYLNPDQFIKDKVEAH